LKFVNILYHTEHKAILLYYNIQMNCESTPLEYVSLDKWSKTYDIAKNVVVASGLIAIGASFINDYYFVKNSGCPSKQNHCDFVIWNRVNKTVKVVTLIGSIAIIMEGIRNIIN